MIKMNFQRSRKCSMWLRRMFSSRQESEEESLSYDVCVVGAGVSGLSAAIRMKQKNQNINVCILEKGSTIGSHVLSGNVFDPIYFEELFPNWQNSSNKPPLTQKVQNESFLILTENRSYRVPHFLFPNSIKNKDNYIISLGELCDWMSKEAESLGVDIFPGFGGKDLLKGGKGEVIGVKTADFGIKKNGIKGDDFIKGMKIYAKQTILAEGARGSLSSKVIEDFNLRSNGADPQSYGLGIKEVWHSKNTEPGLVLHSVGYPLSDSEYGGGFLYTRADELNGGYQIHLGLVTGLDYKNPYLNPYEEFQRWKSHSDIKRFLKEATVVKYGARVLNEGGYWAIPNLTFPGGILVGCSAGFLDVSKIKGSHNAIKSGIIAGDCLSREDIKEGETLDSYQKEMQSSEIYKELYKSRNFKGGFKKGMIKGMIHGSFTLLLHGKEPWHLRNNKLDSQSTERSAHHKPINYPKPDGVYSFNIMESVSRSGTHHDHDQPSHLTIKPSRKDSPAESLKDYAAFEERFCPAKVYEFIEDDQGNRKLHINAQNCIHCKTCSVKSLNQYIDWSIPQGGEGPE